MPNQLNRRLAPRRYRSRLNLVILVGLVGFLIWLNQAIEKPAVENYLPGGAAALNQTKNLIWQTVENYRQAIAERDFAGAQQRLYRPTDCRRLTRAKCREIFFTLADYGLIHVANFSRTNALWRLDQKQAVILSPTALAAAPDSILLKRTVIYLVNRDGDWRIVGVETLLASEPRGGPERPPAAVTRLTEELQDDDQDGLPNQLETCVSPRAKPPCQRTDPVVADSDGDGFWDGLEVALETRPDVAGNRPW